MNNLPAVVSAAVLTGGKGQRMGGTCKALMELGGVPLVWRVAMALEDIFEEVFIVTREQEGFETLGLRIVLDRYESRSSLTGIHAAIDGADTDYVFVSACDTPFLQPALVHALLERIDHEADVIVPQRDGWYYYPLCAIYSRRCLPFIEARLEDERLQTVDFFSEVNVLPVPLTQLLPYDPTLRSLMNVNTPEDLALASDMLAGTF